MPRIALMADLHLGAAGSAAPGLPRGHLEKIFLRAAGSVARSRPAALILAGDIFDSPAPGPSEVRVLREGIRRVVRRGVPVLMLAGTRDTPLLRSDPGPLSLIAREKGVVIATTAVLAVPIRGTGIHVQLVPHAMLREGSFPRLRPRTGARWNVLAAHGWPTIAAETDAEAIRANDWDWVVLGGDHRHRKERGGLLRIGSLERVGPDPWQESGIRKGWVSVDLESGVATLHPLPAIPLVETAPIRSRNQPVAQVNHRLRMALESVPGGIDDRRVRVRILGIDPDSRLNLDFPHLTAARRRAAGIEVQLRSGEDPPPLARLPLYPGRQGFRVLTGDPGRGTRAALGFCLRDLATDAGTDDREGDGSAWLWEDPDPAPEALWLERFPPLLAGWRIGGLESRGQGGISSPRPPMPAGLDGSDSLLPGSLQALRAEADELDGVVEERLVAWLRDRQDAETQLRNLRSEAAGLRDRFRALRTGGPDEPCPTCGRPLAEERGHVLAEGDEAWERLVQDGRWWRRRREQLEEKPADLLALEERALELHARIQAVLDHPSDPDGFPGDARTGNPGSDPTADCRVALIARAGDLFNRATGGRVAGLDDRDGRLLALSEGTTRSAGADEAVLLPLLLRIAAVELALEAGVRPRVLRIAGVLEALPPRFLLPVVELLRRLSRHLPALIADAPVAVVERCAERFDGFLSLEGWTADQEPRIVALPGGTVRIPIDSGG